MVGLGNSGAEIATDLVEQGAASVAVAVRTPPLHRHAGALRHRSGSGLRHRPHAARYPTRGRPHRSKAPARAVGDLRPYGLGEAAWGPFTARRPAVIDVGFLGVLKSGGVTVRSALERLTRDGVEYADGSSEAIDVVLVAIGFERGSRACSAMCLTSLATTVSRLPAPESRPPLQVSTSSASTRPSVATFSKRTGSRSDSPGPSPSRSGRANPERPALEHHERRRHDDEQRQGLCKGLIEAEPSTRTVGTVTFIATTTRPTSR